MSCGQETWSLQTFFSDGIAPQVPNDRSSPLPLSAHVLHNLLHIELNAVDLAWDTVARFSCLRLPDQFYEDFARVADDESRHLRWCLQRMGELGHTYGDMPAHNLLWEGAQMSSDDVIARFGQMLSFLSAFAHCRAPLQ